jgi:hypothetical protein
MMNRNALGFDETFDGNCFLCRLFGFGCRFTIFVVQRDFRNFEQV